MDVACVSMKMNGCGSEGKRGGDDDSQIPGLDVGENAAVFIKHRKESRAREKRD